MTQQQPTQTKAWTSSGTKWLDSLTHHTDYPVPTLESHDILVEWSHASLNFRDLIIPQGKYPFPVIDNVVLGSDAAGTVLAVGKDVSKFKKGDKILSQFGQSHQYGEASVEHAQATLGGGRHGVLRQYAVMPDTGVVRMPEHLSLREGSTLPCAGLTAWNALYGLSSKEIYPGSWVLVEGTGGVSVFALQFAKMAGAMVIATTSSDEKAKKLKELGADHVINYKNVKDWGEKAKALTPGGLGVDHIVEVGGPATLNQAFAAIKPGGVVTIIGFVGGEAENAPSPLAPLTSMCIVRGVLVGSVEQFEAMNRAIENAGMKPVLDEREFAFEQLKDAMEYQLGQKHFGKVTVRIS